MKTAKQYKQAWFKFKHERGGGKMTKDMIWTFQQSILNSEEISESNVYKLRLPKSDPRYEIMDITEKAYREARWS